MSVVYYFEFRVTLCVCEVVWLFCFFVFKQKTAYEMRISDWSSDVCSSDLDWSALAVAFVASAITAFISVKWLLRYIQSHRFTAFAVYRVALGAALLLL